MLKTRFIPSLPCPRIASLAVSLTLLLLCAFLMLPAPARAADPGKPAGHVTMEFGQGGFILSAMGGKGTLTFKGRRYAFNVGGMGVGGLGVSKITAAGEVYGLTRIEDFPGAFVQARAGYAAVSGKGAMWLENSNGVVLELHATTKGLSLNLGADGLKIELAPNKKSKPKG